VSDDALPEYVRGLLDPAAYPTPPERVELVQTHISYVFLAGDVVYKTKKPVDFGFIDQVAPEARERNCRREVELNRRLAPGIYLDVVPVVRTPAGRIAVEADGEVLEWAVKMRRLPDDRTLDRLLPAGNAPAGSVELLVRRLVAFHEAAEVVPNDPAFAGGQAVAAWWRREYGESEPFIGVTWQPDDARRTRDFVDRTIESSRALFDERLAAGRVVEGHGDLLTKHVYVLDGAGDDVAIVDCIEFSDWFQFRYLDCGYDLAFLAMDLEALGFPELGDELCGRYIAASHDETLGVLQPLHRCFRAFVRGKVESLGAHAPEVPEATRRALADSAARYFRLAASFAQRAAAPALVVMAGLPGTGSRPRRAPSRGASARRTSRPTPSASSSRASTRARELPTSSARACTALR
jgi:aminoglycoside phosphotransferase family enzyme